jgi:hypothetical protein
MLQQDVLFYGYGKFFQLEYWNWKAGMDGFGRIMLGIVHHATYRTLMGELIPI